MDPNVIEKKWIQGTTAKPDPLTGQTFTGEADAHTFRITGETTGGAAAAITGTISARFLRSDNVTVALTGTLSSGVASVTLTSECYAVPGRFIMSIYSTESSTEMCIYCGIGNVFRTSSDQIAYPSASLPDLEDLVADVQAAIASCPASHTAIQAAVAPTFAQATANPAGTYVWYDGSCYYLPNGHTANASWADTTKTAAVIGNDVADLKSAINVITDVQYDDEDVEDYSSASVSTGRGPKSVVIAPNTTTGYYIKKATVYADEGKDIKFSVFEVKPYYDQPDVMNRKKFIKKYDIITIKADSNGKAEIVFDVPLYLTGYNGTVLVACSKGTDATTANKDSMYYGTYVDSLYTIYNYGKSWYDVQPGEYYDHSYQYLTDASTKPYCPRYDVEYILEADADAITSDTGSILQLETNYNRYDSGIDEHSNNAVRNSAIYNELNITKTETIIPTDTTWKNSEAIQPQGYNGWFTVAYVDETDAVKLKKLDVFATTGASVKLGIWTYRPHAVGSLQGYLTLKSVLGTVTAADSHAVFNLDSIDFDPATEFLGIAASSGAIGWNNNIVNGFVGLWFNSDKGFYDTAVGAENSQLMNAPGKTESASGTVQGNYTITYQLAESKTVTTVTNVKNAVDGMLADVKELKASTPVVDAPLRTPHNKYFCILVDDLTRGALDIADTLLSIGVKPAFGLKMESLGSDITWDEIKKLQDMGFEIAFHGMLHSHTPAGTAPANDAVMIADIAEFKALCDEHGIILHGYLGPNHYPLPVGAFKEFEWARGPYGLDAYGAPDHLGTTFASVSVWSCDPLTAADMPTIKQDMIDAADDLANNQYLTPMCHTQNLVAYIDDYMDVFEAWIAAGLEPLRPMDAVKQSLFNAGGIGDNSTFEIQAGSATNPYFVICGNGAVMHNP